jgi:hypothetical protein
LTAGKIRRKKMDRQYEQWAASRETSESVAIALHELSADPDAWWENGHGDAPEADIIRRAREIESTRGDFENETLFLGGYSAKPGGNRFVEYSQNKYRRIDPRQKRERK